MSERERQALLLATLRDVLETSFFAEIIEESNTEIPLAGRSAIAARLDFSGAATGSFMLVATRDTAHALALEFMGESAEEARPERSGGAGRDVLSTADAEVFKELANILCGAVLSRFRSERCCSLTQPVVCSEAAIAGWGGAAAAETVYSAVLLEDGFVAGYWMLDGSHDQV